MSGAIAGQILGMVLGQGMQGMNDDRQVNLQGRLGAKSVQQWRNMMGIQAQKEMEMWEKTNYGAQVAQMKKAGINPALLYGMGGGGGQSMGGSAPVGATGSAGGGGGQEVQQMLGLAQQGVAQVALLKAQKENIEADTANKKAGTGKTNLEAEAQNQANAMTAWLQSVDEEGKSVEGQMHKSVRGNTEVQENKEKMAGTKFKLDENDRQALMNSKVMEEIGAKISLMAKQGMSQDEIYKNLQKEGKLLDAEIEWNALDISTDSVGKFLWNVIKLALRPR